jgi:twitching motility protein PilI
MVQPIELNEGYISPVKNFPYLSLELDPQTLIFVELQYVRETLVLPVERVTQMPNVHPCLIGLVEHRSYIFWVVDLPQLFASEAIDTSKINLHVAVLEIGNIFLGLGVYRIGKVQNIEQERILAIERSPSVLSFPPVIKSLLKGFVVDRAEINLHQGYLVNAEAIVGFAFN